MLHNRIIHNLANEHILESTTFIHDDASPYIAKQVKDLLFRSFGGDRMLRRYFRYYSSPRSPDLNPSVYWLWGYLKSQIYNYTTDINMGAKREHP